MSSVLADQKQAVLRKNGQDEDSVCGSAQTTRLGIKSLHRHRDQRTRAFASA